jgi:hypothetical protein
MVFRRLLLPATLALAVTIGYAQSKTPKPKAPGKVTPPPIEIYLGDTGTRSGGPITKEEFDVLAPQGIRLKEPGGAYIEGFTFTYGERHLYEDSVGNDKLVTEYLSEYCIGDSLSPIISKTLPYRTKPGDTAYYDGINVRLPGGGSARAKPMKFVIVRSSAEAFR